MDKYHEQYYQEHKIEKAEYYQKHKVERARYGKNGGQNILTI